MFTKLRKPVPDRDRVVILEDNGIADIAHVFDSDESAIYAESAVQEYAIPLSDLQSFVGPSGRIFVLRAAAEVEYVKYTKNLAELQKSIVLHKVTQFFQPPKEDDSGKLKIRDIMLYGLIGILVLGVIFK